MGEKQIENFRDAASLCPRLAARQVCAFTASSLVVSAQVFRSNGRRVRRDVLRDGKLPG